MFPTYPYINVNDLNLDYLLKSIKEIQTQVEYFVSLNAIKYADPIQWDITRQYEKNTIVIDPQTGTAYISVAPVPIGARLTRPEYWTVVFDLGSFVVRASKNFAINYEADTTTTATFNTPKGGWLVWGDVLYIANVPITAGDSYVEGGNISHFTMEEITGHLSDLLTTDKDSIVDAINELYTALNNAVNTLSLIIGDLNDLTTSDKTSVVNAINSIVTDITNLINITIGDLNDLTTSDKTSVVNAINSLVTDLSNLDVKIGNLDVKIGNLANLMTTDKTSIVNAINELASTRASMIITPEDFGAVGDGNADDRQALQDAINAATKDGKVVMLNGNATYLIDSFPVGETNLIELQPNTKIYGNGATIKLGNDMIHRRTTSYGNAFNELLGNQYTGTSSDDYGTVILTDIIFNFNGSNNKFVSPDVACNDAIYCTRFDTLIIANCKFIEFTGHQCVFVPGLYTARGKAYLLNNYVHNVGNAVSGNYCADHSSLFCEAGFVMMDGNYLINDSMPTNHCSMEIYGYYCINTNNTVMNYNNGCYTGGMFVSGFWDGSKYHKYSKIANNNFFIDSVAVEGEVYDGSIVGTIDILNNHFEKDGTVYYPSLLAFNNNNAIPDAETSNFNLNIIDNVLIGGKIGIKDQHAVIKGNTIKDFTWYGVMITSKAGSSIDILIEDNVIEPKQDSYNADGCIYIDASISSGNIDFINNTFKLSNVTYPAFFNRTANGTITGHILNNNIYGNTSNIFDQPNNVGMFINQTYYNAPTTASIAAAENSRIVHNNHVYIATSTPGVWTDYTI